MKIGIINTFTSNIQSVFNALDCLGYLEYEEISSKNLNFDKNFSHIILPGNGSFKDNMNKIRESKLDKFIRKQFEEKKFFLGICVGMQILATYGEENEIIEGLNIIPGTVKKIPVSKKKIPHIGWNEISFTKKDKLFKGIENSENIFYFLHSYFFEPKNISSVLCTTKYEVDFPVSIKINNFYGVQFHPEKSQAQGLRLIDNFLKLK